MKTAYLYDSVSFFYAGEREVSLISGYDDYIKPRFSTWEPLPSYDDANQRCKFINGAWTVEQIPEITVYHSITGDELVILEGQEIPDGYQETQPEPMTQEDFNAYKEVKKDALRRDCKASITNLFVSDALGSNHNYDCRPEDQSNIVTRAKASEIDGLTKKVWAHDGVEFTRTDHTTAQLQQLVVDMESHIEANQAKLEGLINQVNAATTDSEVDAVTW